MSNIDTEPVGAPDPLDLPIFADAHAPDEGARPKSPFSTRAALAVTAPPRPRTSSAARRRSHPLPTDVPVATGAFGLPTGVGPAPAPTDGHVDWAQVKSFRQQASHRLMQRLGEDETRLGMDIEEERELGRSIINEILDEAAEEALLAGERGAERVWSAEEQRLLANRVFDALFGLGRLQPLVDDDTVENVTILGHETCFIEHTDGRLERVAPVADSDSELIEFLQFIAARSESAARVFSPAQPRLHLRLDGGARLAAAAWVVSRPSVVIRRHRMRLVFLDEIPEEASELVDETNPPMSLVAKGTITPVMASFLAAAVRARLSIVVAGQQGAGKTTGVRALCAEIPSNEWIGTFETERELFLDEQPTIHPVVYDWEARPGTGERQADGTSAGEVTINDCLYDSFRFNLTRQIVGEVRGREVWAMIKAMESGAGSISTTHARDADSAFRKLVTCAMEDGPQVSRELATSKLAETLDLIVQMRVVTQQVGDGVWERHRYVSEIVAITPGEVAKGYAATYVFKDAGDGVAVPGILPDHLTYLKDFGFNLEQYLREGSIAESQIAEALR